MKPVSIKPIFVLFLDIHFLPSSSKVKYIKDTEKFLKQHPINKDFYIMIIPILTETKVQVFYPEGTKNKNYDDLIKEIGKLTAKKNIRIKL